MKLRIKFKKYGKMIYIGHLDLLRYFQKSIRRAGIDIAYSEGFSPHQIMSFAAPLGVGTYSNAEYCDIVVNSATSAKEMIKALNDVNVEGVEIVNITKLEDGVKNAMATVANA
ncbi:MAG: TIGR03936 family radical SAM-associated protein, partial [Parasporobacterium sp.]|nr:TIGR03936 family radical SAM-associated protein [Parasporobacterium sp.]